MDVMGDIHGVPGLFVASLFSGALRYDHMYIITESGGIKFMSREDAGNFTRQKLQGDILVLIFLGNC